MTSPRFVAQRIQQQIQYGGRIVVCLSVLELVTTLLYFYPRSCPCASVNFNILCLVMELCTELDEIDRELKEIESQIESLLERQQFLQSRKEMIQSQICNGLDSGKPCSSAQENQNRQNWSTNNFPWSGKVETTREGAFKIKKFRPLQLECINATMAGSDCILIMPTGGGKSLCFQLPAVISTGITLVVSPLISLIEDQLMALNELKINSSFLNANCTKEEVNAVHHAMVDKKSDLKLLYVTPEKIAKSKRFMAKLEKTFEGGRLSRIVIDEVHCASQWGHDFRPDYKILGILKRQFPGVPILGLTATATTKVVDDVKKILGLQKDCVLFKASFNRPNLFYEVRHKPSKHDECMDEIQRLLTQKFPGQSGIVYCFSRKDSVTISSSLMSRGIKAACYHGDLDGQSRSEVHRAWTSNAIQVVVATVAFGMGIDKADVHFVIHHSLSKSMENFYQESGRAGRDDKESQCILFYRPFDMFQQSTMVFTEQTGLENLYGMLAYCQEQKTCRRGLIGRHFGESWNPTECHVMCDNCKTTADQVDGNACSLLLRTAWCQSTEIDYAEAVRWFSSALVVTHEACQLLLPELPVTRVAAALAATPLAQPPPGAPWETSTTSTTSTTSPVMDALAEALAVAMHEEMSCWGEGAAWPGKMAPLLLLFRILPDAGGSPLQAQARLIALRALQQEARCLEHRLLEFLQNECGHQHPVLRHLAKVVHGADADGAAMGPLGFRAVAVPQLAVTQLGLAERGPPFPVPVTSVAKVLESQQLQWEELYRKKFPHRRLQWTSLGAVQLLWRHRKGETLLIATERQCHVLLAVDEGRASECEAKEDTWQHELLPLQQVLTADECHVARLDLRVVPRDAAPVVQELTARSSQSAAVVDAALVRLLKRFHVLTGEEILRKLSQYPESLELGAELCGPKAFSDARAAAQDDGREAFQRLCALCDRGLLREETQEVGGNTLTLAGSKAVETPLQPGEFLQRRFFYET